MAEEYEELPDLNDSQDLDINTIFDISKYSSDELDKADSFYDGHNFSFKDGSYGFSPYFMMASTLYNFQDDINNRKYYKDVKAQQDALRSRYANVLVCPSDYNINNININDVNKTEINKELESNTTYNALMATSCILDSLKYNKKKRKALDAVNDKFKNYIVGLDKINVNSAEGFTYFASIKDLGNVLVLKFPIHSKDKSLLHEMLVGIIGTNLLKPDNFNIAFIFGGFTCSKPIEDDTGVISWCDTKGEMVSYIAYENIRDSVSLKKFIRTCKIKDFEEICRQLFYTLYFANEEIDFTHYDLHTDNILVQDLGQNYSIPFKSPSGKTIYSNSRYLIKIIDLGQSHIKYEGRDIGRSGIELFSIYPDRSFGICDIYKFLLFAAHNAATYNDVGDIDMEIFDNLFFDNQDVILFIYNLINNNYTITQTDTNNLNCREILREILITNRVSLIQLTNLFAYFAFLRNINVVGIVNALTSISSKILTQLVNLYSEADKAKRFTSYKRLFKNIITSFNMQDLYECLLSSDVRDPDEFINPEIYEICKDLYSFFNTETEFDLALKSTFIYRLNYCRYTRGVKIEDFLRFYEERYNIHMKPRYQILDEKYSVSAVKDLLNIY